MNKKDIHKKTIGLVGYGNMGQAIAQIHKDEFEVLYFDKNKKSISLEALIEKLEIIIIAVKPQNFSEIKEGLVQYISKGQVVISIMAGVSLENIGANLQTKNVVRSMPNLALKNRASVTGWISSAGCSQKAKNIAKHIFGRWGEAIECKKEDQLNAITALAGSGPAYYLYVSEQIFDLAQQNGFSKKESQQLAAGVLKGAGLIDPEGKHNPADLISKIASKGGTTEAALMELENKKAASIIRAAIKKAQNRSRELSK
ncbi:NAD(P)-binding domain-containing protein [Patescibacteria group bacterium]|nr:NAD(P)-binding domain-containing protein [Patescibacteria group bacterium]